RPLGHHLERRIVAAADHLHAHEIEAFGLHLGLDDAGQLGDVRHARSFVRKKQLPVPAPPRGPASTCITMSRRSATYRRAARHRQAAYCAAYCGVPMALTCAHFRASKAPFDIERRSPAMLHRPRLALAFLFVLLGCGGAGGNQAVAQEGARPFAMTPVGDVEEPWAIAFMADGRALVTEKRGELKIWRPGGEVIDVAGVPEVAADGQGGMLDVALAPDFAHSRLVYLSYAEPGEGGSGLALGRGR